MIRCLKTVILCIVIVAIAGCATGGVSKSSSSGAVATTAADTGIRGKVSQDENMPAKGAYVYAYETPYNDMRVPTKFISAPCSEDGSYVLHLSSGNWYIVARKRTSGDPKGYLVKGDYEGKYTANPLTVRQGSFTPADIQISRLAGNFLLAPYIAEGGMGISGRVTDENGKPAAGAFVLVYEDREMIGLPAFMSRATDKNGEYKVGLAKPGTYFVAARIKYGGIPKKGEPYGTYDKDAEHRVVVNEKENLTGIDVRLTPFPKDLATPVPSAPKP